MDNFTPRQNENGHSPEILQPTPPQPPNRLATASLITGTAAMVCCCVPILQFVLAMSGIVLAIISKQGKPFTGQALTGLILSIISLIISLVIFASIIFTYQMLRDPEVGPMYNQMYQEMMDYWNKIGVPAN